MVKPLDATGKESKQIVIDNLKINYFIFKRKVKYVRLEMRPEGLFIIVPRQFKDENSIFDQFESWIRRTYRKRVEILSNSVISEDQFLLFGQYYTIKDNKDIKKLKIDHTNKLIELDLNTHLKELANYLKDSLKESLRPLIMGYSIKLKQSFNNIVIKRQKTKWASCSYKRNLNFNLKLIAIPFDLLRYITYHEMLHLIYRGHKQDFKKAIKNEFPNIKEIKKELFRYWILINENKIWNKIL